MNREVLLSKNNEYLSRRIKPDVAEVDCKGGGGGGDGALGSWTAPVKLILVVSKDKLLHLEGAAAGGGFRSPGILHWELWNQKI